MQFTEAEKRRIRAERFGVPLNANDKKALRAERFGLTQPQTDAEKAAKRSERFATNNNAQSSGGEGEAKLLARAARFGLPVSQASQNGAPKRTRVRNSSVQKPLFCLIFFALNQKYLSIYFSTHRN